jgi:hypothetical protein
MGEPIALEGDLCAVLFPAVLFSRPCGAYVSRLSILRNGIFLVEWQMRSWGFSRISCRPCWRWRTPCGFP